MESDLDFSLDSPATKFMVSCMNNRSMNNVERSLDPIPNELALHEYRPSLFESLPTELRWLIYEELGYPVGRQRKVKSENPDTCKLAKGKNLSRKPREIKYEEKENTYVHGMPIRGYELFSSVEDLLDIVEGLRTTPVCYDHETPLIEMEYNLLWVNKFIRADVLSLLLYRGGRTFTFYHGLSERAIFYDNWHNVGSYGRGIYRYMRLETSVFKFMTRIHLTDRIGSCYAAERPHGCGYLVSLVLVPAIDGKLASRKPSKPKHCVVKPKHIASMVVAFAELARRCVALELVVLACPWCSEDLDLTGKVVNSYMPWKSCIHAGALKVCYLQALSLKDTQWYMQEEVVETWARS